MILSILTLLGLANSAIFKREEPRIVIGNDDGWATANIRALYNSLNQAGYQSLISAPAVDKSGTGSAEFPPTTLQSAGEFGTIPAGAPAIGTDPHDPRIYYINSFPATAINYGISQFAPQVLGSAPDLAVSGVNVGNNLGSTTLISGTVGAAGKAITMGIPAIAFSGAGGSKHIYTEADPVADIYAQVATKLVTAIILSGPPFLPPGVGLNVNIPLANQTQCTRLQDYTFILSRVNPALPFTSDVTQCGTSILPTESSVLASGGCRVSVSVFDGLTKLDVDKSKQEIVRNKLVLFLRCM